MDLLGNEKLLAYADDIMVIGKTHAEIINTTGDLIATTKSRLTMTNPSMNIKTKKDTGLIQSNHTYKVVHQDQA